MEDREFVKAAWLGAVGALVVGAKTLKEFRTYEIPFA
jgi:hypothetical protein